MAEKVRGRWPLPRVPSQEEVEERLEVRRHASARGRRRGGLRGLVVTPHPVMEHDESLSHSQQIVFLWLLTKKKRIRDTRLQNVYCSDQSQHVTGSPILRKQHGLISKVRRFAV